MAYKYVLNPITGKLDKVFVPSYGSPVTIGSTNSPGVADTGARSDHVHAHGDQGGGSLHATATTSVSGFMSAADKIKLDGLSLNPVNIIEVIANNTISTTNGGFTVIPQMTITPAAGTYLLMFVANYALSDQADAEIMMHIGGGAQSNTLQILDINGSGTLGPVARNDSTTAFNRIITVNGSQTVDVRWRATSNTVTLRTRTMHLIRIS